MFDTWGDTQMAQVEERILKWVLVDEAVELLGISRSTLFRKISKGEIEAKINKDLINVFVPTTPNPTSGFLLMFPKNEVLFLDMTFEEASKFIVSAGTSNPKRN